MKCCLPAIAFLLWAQPAHAICVATSLSGVPATATYAGASNEYNVYDATERMQTIDFDVITQTSLGGCRYFIAVTAGSSNNINQRSMVRGPDVLNYNIYTTAGKAAVVTAPGSFNGAGSPSGAFAFLGGLQTQHLSLYWTIDPLQAVSYSTTRFADLVTIGVYAELAVGIYTLSDFKTITFQARAESSVDLSLVDAAGAFNAGDTAQTINFGDMTTGAVQQFDTMIRSNQGYSITFQSAHGSVLQHLDYPAVIASVPYTLTFGGVTKNLSAGTPTTMAVSTATTPPTGDRYDTRLTLGALDGTEPAGNYQDIITVVLTSN